MSDIVRKVYVYSAEATNYEKSETRDESGEIKEDILPVSIDPMPLFEHLHGKPIHSRATGTTRLKIDARVVGMEVFEVHSDYVRGRFYAEKTGVSGSVVLYDDTTQKQSESNLAPGEGGEIYDSAYFVYIPQTRVIAIERNRDVPYHSSFARYALAYATKNGIIIEDLRLRKIPVRSPLEKIMDIEFVEDISIRISFLAAARLEGDNPIARMVRDAGGTFEKSGTIEINLSAEKTKSGRQNIFEKVDVRDFWIENRELVTRLVVNENKRSQVYFGENQLMFEIKVDQIFGNVNGSRLMDLIYERLVESRLT